MDPQQKVTTSLLLLFICAMAVQGNDIYALYRPLYEAQRGPLLKPNADNVTAECQAEFQYLLYNGTAALVYALDSFGKPQPGFLVGNWAWYGHFSECSNLEGFKYCLLNMIVDAAVIPSLNLPAIPIQWGVCAPSLCSNEDVHNSVETLLEYLHLTYNGLKLVNVSAAVSCVQKPVVPHSPGFYCCISVCAVVGVLMIVGSVIDVIERRPASIESVLSVQSGDITPLIPNQENKTAGENDSDSKRAPDSGWRKIIRKIFSCLRLLLLDFALNRNLKKLMTISETNERSIDCLNGIRVLSMFWVILGHTFAFGVGYIGLVNYADVYGWTQKFMFQTILNAYFSVDSFFFLRFVGFCYWVIPHQINQYSENCGLLVCYLTLLKLEKKNGHIPWHWFYIHRYIRLTPVMLVTIMIWMYISPYTLWGPKAEQLSARPLCPKYWWANVLYIQNFYPSQFGLACISWTWYLANDMQFFIISPFIIYTLYKLPWVGYCLIGSLMFGSLAVTGVLTAHFDFPSSTSAIAVGLPPGSGDYGNIIYQKPYVRIPPYLVGMLIGYIMYRLKDKHVTIPRSLLALGWLLASGVGIAVVYGVYGDYNHNPLSEAANVAYQMFSRCAWSVFLGWTVLSCKYGGPGWINDILSWKFWVPLSRVTYTAYLLHPMVIFTFLGNFDSAYYGSLVLLSYHFCGVILMSYACAIVLSLAVEFPLANLEKHFMPKM